MGGIREFTGKPPKVMGHVCGPVLSTWVLLSLRTIAPDRTYFELDGIVSKATRTALQRPGSTAFIVPSGNRLRIDIFVAVCGFSGHSYYMGWISTDYEPNR
jgi:hypothetical protein